MKLSKEKILELIAENQDALKKLGVKKLGLFGSAARGEATDLSDLDFVVEFEKIGFDAYMDTKFFLEDLFGLKVDLVIISDIKPVLRSNILGEAVYAQGF